MRTEVKNAMLILDTSTIRDAMQALRQSGHRIVFILNGDERVVGVLTDGDIRLALLKGATIASPVKDYMNIDFIYVAEGTPKEQVLKLLSDRVVAVPVLDKDFRFVDFVGRGYLYLKGEVCALARAPARLSLAGGGTDFTTYFMKHGGVTLSSTISFFSHAALKKRDDKKIIITSHDLNEQIEYNNIDTLQNDDRLGLIKAGICVMRPDYGFEVEVCCDLPIGSGLGGSASVLAAIIGCFNEFRLEKLDNYSIAELAYEAERLELNISGGWQDQYSTIFGGFNFIEFNHESNLVTPLRLQEEILSELEERMIICHTGVAHLGSAVQDRNVNGDPDKPENIEFINKLKTLTIQMRVDLLKGRLGDFGKLLHETWELKKLHNNLTTTAELDNIYDQVIEAGSDGGRLVGTGGGGYFLFFVKPFKKYKVLQKIKALGLKSECVNLSRSGLQSWTSRI